jgi:hypothetical protein
MSDGEYIDLTAPTPRTVYRGFSIEDRASGVRVHFTDSTFVEIESHEAAIKYIDARVLEFDAFHRQ